MLQPIKQKGPSCFFASLCSLFPIDNYRKLEVYYNMTFDLQGDLHWTKRVLGPMFPNIPDYVWTMVSLRPEVWKYIYGSGKIRIAMDFSGRGLLCLAAEDPNAPDIIEFTRRHVVAFEHHTVMNPSTGELYKVDDFLLEIMSAGWFIEDIIAVEHLTKQEGYGNIGKVGVFDAVY